MKFVAVDHRAGERRLRPAGVGIVAVSAATREGTRRRRPPRGRAAAGTNAVYPFLKKKSALAGHRGPPMPAASSPVGPPCLTRTGVAGGHRWSSHSSISASMGIVVLADLVLLVCVGSLSLHCWHHLFAVTTRTAHLTRGSAFRRMTVPSQCPRASNDRHRGQQGGKRMCLEGCKVFVEDVRAQFRWIHWVHHSAKGMTAVCRS